MTEAKTVFQPVSCEFDSLITVISQRPRRLCQVLTHWKLQAVEAAAVRGRVIPRLRHAHATLLRIRESIWCRGRGQDLWIMGEPSRPHDTVLWSSCLEKSKIVPITVSSGQLVFTQTKRSASAVLTCCVTPHQTSTPNTKPRLQSSTTVLN